MTANATVSRPGDHAPGIVVVLNGPLGIGKSTLAEALAEAIEGCVMLDGDHLVALNPEPADATAVLHDVVAMLVAHHRRAGYRHAVVNHLWRTPAELDALRGRLREIEPGLRVHCFLLTLGLDENLQRIRRRQGARALDEAAFEQRTVMEEREALAGKGHALGEPFDVSGPLGALVARLLRRIAMQ